MAVDRPFEILHFDSPIVRILLLRTIRIVSHTRSSAVTAFLLPSRRTAAFVRSSLVAGLSWRLELVRLTPSFPTPSIHTPLLHTIVCHRKRQTHIRYTHVSTAQSLIHLWLNQNPIKINLKPESTWSLSLRSPLRSFNRSLRSLSYHFALVLLCSIDQVIHFLFCIATLETWIELLLSVQHVRRPTFHPKRDRLIAAFERFIRNRSSLVLCVRIVRVTVVVIVGHLLMTPAPAGLLVRTGPVDVRNVRFFRIHRLLGVTLFSLP